MWLKSVEIKNIKGFREETILFHNKNNPYKWITLLGENGVGKSTLLQAIALLLAGSDGAKKLMLSPQNWVRNNSEYGQLTAKIQKNNDDEGMMVDKDKGRNKFSYDYSYVVIGNKNTRIGGENYPANTLNPKNSKTLEWLRTNAFTLDSQGWFAAGYGPFRRLSRTEGNPVNLRELKRADRESNFRTQFEENDSLKTFQEWMVFLDYRIAKNPDDSKSKHMMKLGKESIIELLPGNINFDQVTNDGIILFSLENQLIPITQLSDGFRSIIALVGDLIWRLLQTFSHLEDPRKASGIVLIDELDIHLHPVWQRLIAKKLRTVFPHLQFFVATHSPFVAAGAGDDALTLTVKMINGEVQIEEVENIAAYDVDYILRSPAFGLVSTHSPATQEKIDRYDYLTSNRNNLQGEEIEEYEKLRQFMKEFQPIGGKPEPGSLEDKINKFLEENL
jgi:AAA15 family ATPase/GTPase